MDGTGGAGTGTPALRLDTRNAVLDRGLHDGRTEFALDRARGAFVIDVGDARHVNGGEIVAGGAATPGSYSCWRGRAPDERRDQSAVSKPVRRGGRRHPREQMHGPAIDTGDRLAIPDI